MKGRGVRIDLLLINLDALKEGGGFLQQISLVLFEDFNRFFLMVSRPAARQAAPEIDIVAYSPTKLLKAWEDRRPAHHGLASGL